MNNPIKIEKINYFGNNETGSDNWNGKVLYKYRGRLVVAMIDIDFFARRIYAEKKIQAKECKVYAGLQAALNNMGYFNI